MEALHADCAACDTTVARELTVLKEGEAAGTEKVAYSHSPTDTDIHGIVLEAAAVCHEVACTHHDGATVGRRHARANAAVT